MEHKIVILLAVVHLFGSNFGYVHDYRLSGVVDVTLSKSTSNNITELQTAPIITAANPFGLPGISENTRKDIIIVDGDVASPVGQPRTLFKSTQRWPRGIVPVELDNAYSNNQKNIIITAMSKISEATNNCIRFVWRGNNPYWLRIHPGNGCWSYLGKIVNNGRQDLSLQNPACVHEGTVIHELLHALGHVHEHNRPDRDAWVRINWGNISPGTQSNFNKYSAGEVDTFNYPYDYGSIMHYHSTAFSKNGHRTIETIRPGFENYVNSIGRSGRLAGWDIEKLKKRYGC
ncbi:unnamed protein product [Adineta ricciae]|uniref:Metalloendopeptidase n=1 Tax=Adineta ricciae TaxID=249248 RepID=A0A816FRQ6_ADIRI|nr:unnamed protein product [Adineta ricciae]